MSPAARTARLSCGIHSASRKAAARTHTHFFNPLIANPIHHLSADGTDKFKYLCPKYIDDKE